MVTAAVGVGAIDTLGFYLQRSRRGAQRRLIEVAGLAPDRDQSVKVGSVTAVQPRVFNCSAGLGGGQRPM